MLEGSLILLIIAISAISKKYKEYIELKNSLVPSKNFGNDKYWFKRYLTDRWGSYMSHQSYLASPRIVDGLYVNLRNSAIHEANIVSVDIEDNVLAHLGAGDTFRWGRQILDILADTIRRDPLVRDQFSDLVHELENIIEPISLEKIDSYHDDISKKYQIPPGAIRYLDGILNALTPEVVQKSDFAALSYLIDSKILRNIEICRMSISDFININNSFGFPAYDLLRRKNVFFDLPAIETPDYNSEDIFDLTKATERLDDHHRNICVSGSVGLTPTGYQLLKELSFLYRTVRL